LGQAVAAGGEILRSQLRQGRGNPVDISTHLQPVEDEDFILIPRLAAAAQCS